MLENRIIKHLAFLDCFSKESLYSFETFNKPTEILKYKKNGLIFLLLCVLLLNTSVMKRRLDVTQHRVWHGNNAGPKLNEVISNKWANNRAQAAETEFISYTSWPGKAQNPQSMTYKRYEEEETRFFSCNWVRFQNHFSWGKKSAKIESYISIN